MGLFSSNRFSSQKSRLNHLEDRWWPPYKLIYSFHLQNPLLMKPSAVCMMVEMNTKRLEKSNRDNTQSEFRNIFPDFSTPRCVPHAFFFHNVLHLRRIYKRVGYILEKNKMKKKKLKKYYPRWRFWTRVWRAIKMSILPLFERHCLKFSQHHNWKFVKIEQILRQLQIQQF